MYYLRLGWVVLQHVSVRTNRSMCSSKGVPWRRRRHLIHLIKCSWCWLQYQYNMSILMWYCCSILFFSLSDGRKRGRPWAQCNWVVLVDGLCFSFRIWVSMIPPTTVIAEAPIGFFVVTYSTFNSFQLLKKVFREETLPIVLLQDINIRVNFQS